MVISGRLKVRECTYSLKYTREMHRSRDFFLQKVRRSWKFTLAKFRGRCDLNRYILSLIKCFSLFLTLLHYFILFLHLKSSFSTQKPISADAVLPTRKLIREVYVITVQHKSQKGQLKNYDRLMLCGVLTPFFVKIDKNINQSHYVPLPTCTQKY